MQQSGNDKKYLKKQMVINSKCLKGKSKFKPFFVVIRPEVSYDLLPLELKIKKRLSSMEIHPKQDDQLPVDNRDLLENTNKMGHLCNKRTRRCEYIKKIRIALGKLKAKFTK